MEPREVQMYGVAATLLVLSIIGAAFLIKGDPALTGFAVAEPPQMPAVQPTNAATPVAIQNLTIQDAENALWEGTRIMADLHARGFGVQFINDTLLEARRVLQKANYTLRLTSARNANDTEAVPLLEEAVLLMANTYSGSTPQESYAEVLRLVAQVKERQDPAYLLLDKLTMGKQKLAEYAERDLPTERGAQLLAEAERSFKDERYAEALRYVDEANAELDRVRTESPMLRALEESSRGFFEKNWKQLLIMAAILAVGGWFGWKRMGVYQLKRRIQRLRIERDSLAKLIEEAQRDCFERKTISQMTYDLRMDTYRRRRAEIQVLLPTLQEELREVSKGKETIDLGPERAPQSGALRVEFPQKSSSKPAPPAKREGKRRAKR